MVEGEFQRKLVEMVGGDAGLDVLDQHVETFGDQPPGLAHALEGILAVQLDLAGFSERCSGRFNVGHIASRNSWVVNLRAGRAKASKVEFSRWPCVL